MSQPSFSLLHKILLRKKERSCRALGRLALAVAAISLWLGAPVSLRGQAPGKLGAWRVVSFGAAPGAIEWPEAGPGATFSPTRARRPSGRGIGVARVDGTSISLLGPEGGPPAIEIVFAPPCPIPGVRPQMGIRYADGTKAWYRLRSDLSAWQRETVGSSCPFAF